LGKARRASSRGKTRGRLAGQARGASSLARKKIVRRSQEKKIFFEKASYNIYANMLEVALIYDNTAPQEPSSTNSLLALTQISL
jgi:hypothetical protein